MNNFIIIVAVVFVAFGVICLLAFCKQEKLTRNTVLCFTGGLGSGKTFMAVKCGVQFYKKQRLHYLIGKALHIKKWNDKPCILSNFPIKLGRNKYSEILTREHLLLKRDIPEKAIVIIDEVGQVASQYDFDNVYVMKFLQELIRYFRHYTDGKLILTDQSSDNIVVPIRRRVNLIYNLNDFHRYFKVLPFFKVDVSVLEVTEGSVMNMSAIQNTEKHLLTNVKLNKPYFFGVLPYKFLKMAKYDTRCYSVRYNHDTKDKTVESWEQMKTTYIIDIGVSEDLKRLYKKYRDSLDWDKLKDNVVDSVMNDKVDKIIYQNYFKE